MSRKFIAALFAVCIAAAGLLAARNAFTASPDDASSGDSKCVGGYADTVGALKSDNRAFESSPDAAYTYCIRNSVTYENVYYVKGGKLRKKYITKEFHGTGFAYKIKDGETYLVTNHHVSEFPEVTESDGDVGGVPAGSRKIREILKIVKNEDDDFVAGQIPLTKVVSDEAMDISILKTKTALKIMPYVMGDSSLLKVGNIIIIKGYPLGVFPASNNGRVISINQLDTEKGWNHYDFAVDALVNSGNSGSPAFAVSCKTGEYELVGVYHAGYKNSQGMNMVIEINQIKELLETLKVSPKDAKPEDDPKPDKKAVLEQLPQGGAPDFLPFGERTIKVEFTNGEFRVSLLTSDFPLLVKAQFTLIDRNMDDAYPQVLLLPDHFGSVELPWARLDSGVKEQMLRFYLAAWKQLALVQAYRSASLKNASSDDASPSAQKIKSKIRKLKAEQTNIIEAIDFESESIVWPAVSVPKQKL